MSLLLPTHHGDSRLFASVLVQGDRRPLERNLVV